MQEQHAPGVKNSIVFTGVTCEDQHGINRLTVASKSKMVVLVTCLLVEDELHEKLKEASEEEMLDLFKLESDFAYAWAAKEKEQEQ